MCINHSAAKCKSYSRSAEFSLFIWITISYTWTFVMMKRLTLNLWKKNLYFQYFRSLAFKMWTRIQGMRRSDPDRQSKDNENPIGPGSTTLLSVHWIEHIQYLCKKNPLNAIGKPKTNLFLVVRPPRPYPPPSSSVVIPFSGFFLSILKKVLFSF